MTRSRLRHQGRRETRPFFMWPRDVADSDAYTALSAHAVKLLNDLYFQFRGANNGDLSAAWSVMQSRGWKSRDTLCKALKELLAAGMIEKTRQGGRNRCSLYAVTWRSIDECKGKLDMTATTKPSNLWKQQSTVEHAFEKQILGTPSGLRCPVKRASQQPIEPTAMRLTRRAC